MKGTSPSRVSRKAATGHKVPRWEVRTLINSLLDLRRGQIIGTADLGYGSLSRRAQQLGMTLVPTAPAAQAA
jgi:hypothetical protein